MSTSYAARRLLAGTVATLISAACAPIPYAVAAAQAPAQSLTEQAVHHYEAGQQTQALDEFHRAAEQGNRLAQFDYAMMLLNGEGGAPDPEGAVHWLERAANAGMTQAQYVYGKMFDDGYVVGKSIPQANHWYEKARSRATYRRRPPSPTSTSSDAAFPRITRPRSGGMKRPRRAAISPRSTSWRVTTSAAMAS